MSITQLNIQNPDSESIVNKERIDISVSLFDISASGHSGSVNTNYTTTLQLITVPLDEATDRNLYYTPIYKEEINYSTWLTRINKNFQELT
jgi:uncharacterized phage protein gp47/JayE